MTLLTVAFIYLQNGRRISEESSNNDFLRIRIGFSLVLIIHIVFISKFCFALNVFAIVGRADGWSDVSWVEIERNWVGTCWRFVRLFYHLMLWWVLKGCQMELRPKARRGNLGILKANMQWLLFIVWIVEYYLVLRKF